MSDIDLGQIGEQMAPVLWAVFRVLMAVLLTSSVITATVTYFIIKKKFVRVKPIFRLLISLLVGIVTFPLVLWIIMNN
ncbi:MAG: hypothetical protein UU77_C0059G0004 [candidate division WWE3 bacterium GW2011_GWC1_41_7]|uniref:Uncharacterized protein n=2 Tax=Katanobacteria TaxID=422282 RepID=A0A0G0X3R3_UNCKA|nr:MAG: hypothetical protein UU77_C0059G0004 [candidate division WWE3 bacterium GW2011_GWC1_41_7]OGC57410.1 MAG: hypothetical protein A2976_04320 [candidate division WWE3 bacterium RIFCSPLOWO2_01_FULL_41_9]